MFQRLWTVLASTYVETIRQPIYSVILAVTAILMVLNVSLAAFTLEDDNKLLLDLGLSTLLLSGLFLAAFSAAGILSREIENKTVLTVISKPIGRPLFIIGKFMGLAAALITAFYISTLIFVLSVRHGVLQNSSDPWDAPVLVFGFGGVFAAILISAFRNYFYGVHFPTSTITLTSFLLTIAVFAASKLDKKWEVIPFASNFGKGIDVVQLLAAAYLVLIIVLVIAAVALAASTRLGQMMTLLTCTCVLGVGIMADYVFGQFETSAAGQTWYELLRSGQYKLLFAHTAYRIVPNVGPFWVIDGLTAQSSFTTVTFEYIKYTTAYGLLFATSMVSLAIALFQRREVG